MVSVSAPSSPNSLQLRFASKNFNSSKPLFKVQFRTSTRWAKLVNSNRHAVQFRSFKIRSQDSFSGWDEADGGEEGDSKKNNRFGGMLGAGLAGVFFTAGITFASLSLSGRTSAGNKQQMQPLLPQQEVAFTYDDQIEKVDENREGTSILQPENQDRKIDAHLDTQTGINKDFPRIEINEDSSQSDIDNIQSSEKLPIENAKLFPNSAETSNENKDFCPSNEDSSQSHSDIILSSENLENAKIFVNSAETSNENFTQDVNEIPIPPTSFPNVPEYSKFDDDNNFPSINDHMTSFPHDPATEHDSTQNITDHSELFSVNTDISTHINDRREGNPVDIDNPLVSFEPSTTYHVNLESSDSMDSLDNSKEMEKIPSQVPGKENFDHSDISNTVLSEIIVPNLDQNEAFVLPAESINPTVDYNAPSIEYSDVVLAGTNSSKPDIPTYSHIGKRSTFESLFNEKSNSYAGIPAPSISTALQVRPGKVLVPAFVDQVQGQAFTALQVLKVIEPDAQPGDLCTRREYARWLVTASSALSRNTGSKVYPAMYIENGTELAFDDITHEDPDYSCIQGLAEAGIISSKLSDFSLYGTPTQQQDSFFSPESPVSRQDLVSWKMALEKRQLPEVDRNALYQCSGYIDIDKIHKDAWPALVADLAAGEQGIITLAFGYTKLFQPNKPVTKAQAAIALATGEAAEVVGEELARIEAESLAENVVNTHTALVEQVEKEVNASFESELAKEREKTMYLEKLAEDVKTELEKLKAEEEEQNKALLKKEAAVESELEVLSKLRHEVEEQLQDLMSNKIEISFERDRISQLRKEAESENQLIAQLQHELEVERKALSMARSWAEDEAKKAREHAKVLEVARSRWEKHGIKVVVDDDLKEDALTGVPWLTAIEERSFTGDETINKAESLVKKLKKMSAQIKIKSSNAIENIIEKIQSFIRYVKEITCKASKQAVEMKRSIAAKVSASVEELKANTSGFSSTVSDKAKRAVDECKEGVEKITQKFKA